MPRDANPTPRLTPADRDALRDALTPLITDIVQAANRQLLREHTALQPLLSVQDLARTLRVSVRTVETLIAAGRLRPLWIKGQRRFHPDAVDAYLRSCEKPASNRRPRRRTNA